MGACSHLAASISIDKQRTLDVKTHGLAGKTWLHVHVYQPELDFWSRHEDWEWHDDLRHSYEASVLPSVYDKVHVKKEDTSAMATKHGGSQEWSTRYQTNGGL